MLPPSSSEPIRPIGAFSGGGYVDRSRRVGEVVRRTPRRDGDSNSEDNHSSQQESSQDQDPHVVEDPRAYDDHGRGTNSQTPPDGTSHLDLSA